MALVLLPGKAKMNANLIEGRDDPMPLRQPLTKFEDRTKKLPGPSNVDCGLLQRDLEGFFPECVAKGSRL